MKDIIQQILPLWGIENRQLLQIYPSAWEINDSYVIKVYDDKKRLERNLKITEILFHCTIPVAKIVLTKTGKNMQSIKTYIFFCQKN